LKKRTQTMTILKTMELKKDEAVRKDYEHGCSLETLAINYGLSLSSVEASLERSRLAELKKSPATVKPEDLTVPELREAAKLALLNLRDGTMTEDGQAIVRERYALIAGELGKRMQNARLRPRHGF
jgi:hypothetical protein